MNITEWITTFLDFVQDIDPWLRITIASIAIMFETSVLLGLLVPGDTIVVVAATGTENIVEWAWLVVGCVVGALLGESFGFAIGRWLGPRLEPWLNRKVPRAAAQWRKAERYIERRGGPAIFLSRFLPVAHSLVPLVVGSTDMAYRRFLKWTIPACMIWALAYASVGWLAAGSFRELSDSLHSAGYIFVGVIVAFLGIVWLVKRWLQRREAKHMAE